jgi:ATP-binding cassette subfamily F protein uup
MEISSARDSGDIVVEAKSVTFGYDARPLVVDFSTVIERGDRVGIIGPNGCGKSTLVRLLLGDLTPKSGSVRTGTRIERIYFDQLRGTLDGERSVRENICGDGDYIEINGRRRHVIGYLGDFLFSRTAADLRVSALSGGEKNRLLLAKLFARPSNLIVMDEPTNDLDIETIELLESLLVEYAGTIIVVSHDRTFLDNVATSILSFEGGGRIGEYAGGYEDWLLQRRDVPAVERKKKESTRPARQEAKRKLSFREKIEYEAIPALIEG